MSDGAAAFDRAADLYDAVGVEWFGPIARGHVEALAVRPGERVLDVGCGRGAALLPLAEAVGPTGHALGTDLAPRMVERTAADLAHLPHVQVRLGDAGQPGLPPASYDVVSACLVVFFLPDEAAAVRAWRDLLVPGGRLGITTFGPRDPRWDRVYEVLWRDLPTSPPRPSSSVEELEQVLRDAGLVDVRTVTREHTTAFDDADHWIRFTWSTGQRTVWERMPPEQQAERVAELRVVLAALGQPLTTTQPVRHTLGRRPG